MRQFIYTASGKKFFFDDPQPSTIDIEDIAHATSQLCRWTGHTSKFYSVAEHCIRCSYECTRFPLRALLHDAAEAYISDVNKPLKMLLGIEYARIESVVEWAIAQKFGLGLASEEELTEVKRVDLALAATELRDLLRQKEGSYIGVPLKDEIVSTMTPLYAEIRFLERFKELTHDIRVEVSR